MHNRLIAPTTLLITLCGVLAVACDPPPVDEPDDTDAGVDSDVDAGPDCELLSFFPDTDGDGHGDQGATVQLACEAPEGTVASADDCDDTDAANFPGNTEVCDGADNTCDGVADEGLTFVTYFADVDGDTFGDPAVTQQSCAGAPPAGFVDDVTDCDDNDGANFPGNVEVCDLADNTCDGNADEGVLSTYFIDVDGDGAGSAAETVEGCEAPVGYAALADDCDDADAARAPGLTEVCDQKDNNCDFQTDEGVQTFWYADPDGDGYAIEGTDGSFRCTAPPNTTAVTGDCDEFSAAVHPGAVDDACDFVDTDCDGTVAETRVPDDFPTLQEAVDATADGGHICLRSGTFVGNTVVANKMLRIEGAGSAAGASATVLDGGLAGTTLFLNQAGASTVSNLRVTRGRAQIGAGLRISGGAPAVSDVVSIANDCNTALGCGGAGLAVQSVTGAVITNVTVEANTAISTSYSQSANGTGALFFEAYETTVTGLRAVNNSVVVTNSANAIGVGVMLRYGSITARDITLEGNTVTGTNSIASMMELESGSFSITQLKMRNHAVSSGYGTLLYCNNSSPVVLQNLLIANNTGNFAAVEMSNTSAQIAQMTVAHHNTGASSVRPVLVFSGVSASTSTVTNSIVSDNVGGIQSVNTATMVASYSDFFSTGSYYGTASDPTGSNGNISTAPGFQNGAGGLLYLVEGAAAVNAGDPASPPDTDGTRADMGAFGGPDGFFTPQPG